MVSEDVSRFWGCSSPLLGRGLDENGKPVFRTLERAHESIVSGAPYVLGVLSDTSESSASPTSPGLSQVDEDSEDDADSIIMTAIQHPRWFDGIFRFHTVQIHGLVTPLGRQLNGCVGTIVRVDTAAKRYGVNVDNFGLKSIVSIQPEDLELIILNRAWSGG